MDKWNIPCVLAWCLLIANAQPQSPSYKYSREANEAAQRHEPKEIDPIAHYGHSHGGDGHAAWEHTHSHDKIIHQYEQGYPARKVKSIVMRTADERRMLWIKAVGATLLVSLAPFLILILIPISEKRGNENLLKVFLAFASGGLLGDAFLHLIPHAINPHDGGAHSHEEGHSHDNSVGISVLLGILAFLMVEKFVRLVKGGHSHGHAHCNSESSDQDPKMGDKNYQVKKSDASDKKTDGDSGGKSHNSHGVGTIKVGAYLNLAADFAHNFTDGLALGASFLAGDTPGMISTVIILLHEVPHEIGDFALLVQNGMTKRKAMCVQLVTALGCLAGTFLSLVMEGVGAANWVLPFTAGGFIYIATVSVMPELLENSQLWQSVKEILALIFGVGMMMVLTEYE